MPLRVEAQAALLAIIYYIPSYGNVILEVDCAELLSILASASFMFAPNLLRLRNLLLSLSLPLVHMPRETNVPAHLLAQLALSTQIFTSYPSYFFAFIYSRLHHCRSDATNISSS